MATTFARSFGFGRGARGSHDSTPALNLTPMIDVMTIILIFLVKAYSVTPEYLKPADDLKLSTIRSDVNAPDKAQLVISKEGIFVADKLVVAFHKGQADERFVGQDSVPELERALRQLSKTANFKGSDVLVIQADRELPFDYMKPVIRTAGAAGFHDIKFAGIFEE